MPDNSIKPIHYAIFRSTPERGLFAVMAITPSEFPYYPTAVVYSFRHGHYMTVDYAEDNISIVENQFEWEAPPIEQHVVTGPTGWSFGSSEDEAIRLHLCQAPVLESQTLDVYTVTGPSTANFTFNGQVIARHVDGETAVVKHRQLVVKKDDPIWQSLDV
jgi:hypothetical protein